MVDQFLMDEKNKFYMAISGVGLGILGCLMYQQQSRGSNDVVNYDSNYEQGKGGFLSQFLRQNPNILNKLQNNQELSYSEKSEIIQQQQLQSERTEQILQQYLPANKLEEFLEQKFQICYANEGYFSYICVDCLNTENFSYEKELLLKGIQCFSTDLIPILCEDCFYDQHQGHRYIKISRIRQNLYEKNQCVCGNRSIYENTCLKHMKGYDEKSEKTIEKTVGQMNSGQYKDLRKHFQHVISDAVYQLARANNNQNFIYQILNNIMKLSEENLVLTAILYETMDDVKFLDVLVQQLSTIRIQQRFLSQIIEQMFYQLAVAGKCMQITLFLLTNLENILHCDSLTLNLIMCLSDKQLTRALQKENPQLITQTFQKIDQLIQFTNLERMAYHQIKIVNGIGVLTKLFEADEAIQAQYFKIVLNISFNLQTKLLKQASTANFLKLFSTSDLGLHISALQQIEMSFKIILKNIYQQIKKISLEREFLQYYLELLNKVYLQNKDRETIFFSQSLASILSWILIQEMKDSQVPSGRKGVHHVLTKILSINESSLHEQLLQKVQFLVQNWFLLTKEGFQILQFNKIVRNMKMFKEVENKKRLTQYIDSFSKPIFGDYDLVGFLIQQTSILDALITKSSHSESAHKFLSICLLNDLSISNNVCQKDKEITKKMLIDIFQINEFSIPKEQIEEEISKFCIYDLQTQDLVSQIAQYDPEIDCYELNQAYHDKIFPYLLNRKQSSFEISTKVVQNLNKQGIDPILGTDFLEQDPKTHLQDNQSQIFQYISLKNIKESLKNQKNLCIHLLALRNSIMKIKNKDSDPSTKPLQQSLSELIVQLRSIQNKSDENLYQIMSEKIIVLILKLNLSH